MSALEMSNVKPGRAQNGAASNLPDDPTPITTISPDEGVAASKVTSHRNGHWHRSTSKHRPAMLPSARIEPRPFTHKYFFKRPRLLQYCGDGALVDSQGRKLGPVNPEELVLSASESENGTGDGFVSTAFESGGVWRYAFLEFLVVFETAFRLWSYIRRFFNNFFNKDLGQSIFLIWVLMLALFLGGNQTPYFLDPVGNQYVITTFLVAKASFLFIEGLYCCSFRFRIVLFANILLLDASIRYLIENSLDTEKPSSSLLARWTISGALSGTLLLMTANALLNHSMDAPGTLVVDHRYVRMAPRVAMCIVIMCLPIVKSIHTTAFLGILAALLQLLIFWEFVAGMEKSFQFFEPKDA